MLSHAQCFVAFLLKETLAKENEIDIIVVEKGKTAAMR